MAHEQGNNRDDDPNKFGLKFDAGKPRWELIPAPELCDIIEVVNFFLPTGHNEAYPLDITKFDKALITDLILDHIMEWKRGIKLIENEGYSALAMAAFEVFFLLRDRPYTEDELNRTEGPFRWDLFNLDDIEAVVNVYSMGAKKYADNNWMKVSADRYFGALMRHFKTINSVHRYDSELGCLHMHQVIWNLMSLMWIDNNKDKEIPGD